MTEFRTPLQAGSSAVYNADIEADGVAVLLAQISTITLTLVDKDEAVINSRNAQSILNVNGGVVTNGHLALTLSNLDTAEVTTNPSRVQVRYLHFDIALVGGAVHVHEVLWYVRANHVAGED